MKFAELVKLVPTLPASVPVFFLGRPGVGKCLGLGTPVLMADGRVLPVEQIIGGDRLMGPDGRARMVVGTTRGVGPLFRIDPIKGEPWVCNDVHVLTLVNSYTGEIKDVGLDVYQQRNEKYHHDHKLFSVGVEAFDRAVEPLPVDPYFVGAWFGDGTKGLSTVGGQPMLAKVQITKNEEEIKQLCEATAAAWGLTVSVYAHNCCPHYGIVGSKGHANRLLQALRDLVGRDVRVPDAYLRASRVDRLQFLAGFIDTDGELSSNCFIITQKREDWARAIHFVARSLGFCATITPRTARDQNGTEGVYHVVTISGDTDQIPTRIPRKQATPRKQIKCATRTGFSVTPIGVGDYYGFEVDGDGRFLLGDFTVTHNSAVARAIGEALGPDARVIRRELTGHLPEDISGLPFQAGGFTRFCPPEFLGVLAKGAGPNGADPVGALVLEDITQASRAVQVACFQLVQERSMGDLELSPNVRIILTGNRANDKAGARELPSPLRNRVCLLDLVPDVEEWMAWAHSQGIPGVVGGFLNYRPSAFAQTPNDADKENGQFATPRSWSNLGAVMGSLGPKSDPGGALLTLAGGLVGTGTATEFVAFVKLQHELPDPKAVLDNPEKAIPNPPTEADRLAALTSALGDYAAVNCKKDKKLPLKLLLALGHVCGKKREGIAAGVVVYQANGGDMDALFSSAKQNRDDPRIMAIVKHFAASVS